MNLSLKFQNNSALGTNGLSYRVISIKLKKEHGVKQIQVSWARERSRFTLLFEAMIMALVDEMPVKAIADMVGIEDTRLGIFVPIIGVSSMKKESDALLYCVL